MLNMGYIAETDEHNRVCALWVKPNDRKSARLFDPATERFETTDRATISGASEAAIKQWIAVQKLVSAR